MLNSSRNRAPSPVRSLYLGLAVTAFLIIGWTAWNLSAEWLAGASAARADGSPPLSSQAIIATQAPSKTPARAMLTPARPTFAQSKVSATRVAKKTPTVTVPIASTARKPVMVNGKSYDAYLYAAVKKHQEYHYSCEFDAAWVVLKTNGYDVGVDKQAEIMGMDRSIEPYFKESKGVVTIYGGDVTRGFSGDYKTNFLARSTGSAMRKVFEHFGLKVTAVHDRPGVEAALLRGELVWIKTTVDFKPWRSATWIMPDGRQYKTVLGNDHAAVVMGFNKSGVVIRDVLGPTSTNYEREYEYEVSWPKFLASWGAQSFDGLAVGPTTKK